MPKTKQEKRRLREPTAPGGGQVRSRDTGHGPGHGRVLVHSKEEKKAPFKNSLEMISMLLVDVKKH